MAEIRGRAADEHRDVSFFLRFDVLESDDRGDIRVERSRR